MEPLSHQDRGSLFYVPDATAFKSNDCKDLSDDLPARPEKVYLYTIRSASLCLQPLRYTLPLPVLAKHTT